MREKVSACWGSPNTCSVPGQGGQGEKEDSRFRTEEEEEENYDDEEGEEGWNYGGEEE